MFQVGSEPVLPLPWVGSNMQDNILDPFIMLLPFSWLSLLQGGGPQEGYISPGMAHVNLEQAQGFSARFSLPHVEHQYRHISGDCAEAQAGIQVVGPYRVIDP